MPFNIKERSLGDLVKEMCYLAVKFPYVLNDKEPLISQARKDNYEAFRKIANEISLREQNYKLSERQREALDSHVRIG
jgi:hypothetical protein